jgi:hypothetical protein
MLHLATGCTIMQRLPRIRCDEQLASPGPAELSLHTQHAICVLMVPPPISIATTQPFSITATATSATRAFQSALESQLRRVLHLARALDRLLCLPIVCTPRQLAQPPNQPL